MFDASSLSVSWEALRLVPVLKPVIVDISAKGMSEGKLEAKVTGQCTCRDTRESELGGIKATVLSEIIQWVS